MEQTATTEKFESWAIVELMGHVRCAGRVTEETHFGVPLLRMDIPQPDGGVLTQFYGGQSIYRLTPCSEAAARAVALHNQPVPISRYELPAPAGAAWAGDDDDADYPGPF